MYAHGAATDNERPADFPFYLCDVVVGRAQLPRPAPAVEGGKSLVVSNSWELAVTLCRRFPGASVTMERLRYSTTETVKTIYATGCETLVKGIMVLPPKEAAGRVQASRLRGITALKPAASSGAAAVPDARGEGAVSSAGQPCRLQKTLAAISSTRSSAGSAGGVDSGHDP